MGCIDEDGNQENKTMISVPVKNAAKKLDNAESYEISKNQHFSTLNPIKYN